MTLRSGRSDLFDPNDAVEERPDWFVFVPPIHFFPHPVESGASTIRRYLYELFCRIIGLPNCVRFAVIEVDRTPICGHRGLLLDEQFRLLYDCCGKMSTPLRKCTTIFG